MTSHTLPRLATLGLLAAALSTSAFAESLGSAASSAASSASGSVSDSVQGSSKSSSGETKVADGAYRVLEVAQADKPGHLALRLQLADARKEAESDAAGAFTLRLPQTALGPQGIAVGDIVRVRNRAYGLEFARATQGAEPAPFFLALTDATLRELRSHALSL